MKFLNDIALVTNTGEVLVLKGTGAVTLIPNSGESPSVDLLEISINKRAYKTPYMEIRVDTEGDTRDAVLYGLKIGGQVYLFPNNIRGAITPVAKLPDLTQEEYNKHLLYSTILGLYYIVEKTGEGGAKTYSYYYIPVIYGIPYVQKEVI